LERGRDSIHVAFPSENDLVGSSMSLIRLKDVYQLNIEDIAYGRVPHLTGDYRMTGTIYEIEQYFESHQLCVSVKDVYDIGMEAFRTKDYYHSIIWLGNATEFYARAVAANATDVPSASTIWEPYILSLFRNTPATHKLSALHFP
jgi:hypothetical protein